MRDGNSRTPDGPAGGQSPPGSEPGSVHVIVQDSRTRLVLSGEIDADLAGDLAEATTDAEHAGLPIDVDAQHVTFMDSSGIAFLARLATRSVGPVRVLRAPETVRFLLQVTRIGELLEVVDGVGDETGHGDAVDAGDVGDPDPDLPRIGPGGRVRSGVTEPDGVA